MYQDLRNKIEEYIKNNTPEAVLFSGGIDSTAVLYEASKYNKDVVGITVGVDNNNSSDIVYSREISKLLKINHVIYNVSVDDVKRAVEEAVIILKSFNPEWISSTTTLLLGVKCAQEMGLRSVSGGEGADDLFGSFPFFKAMKDDYNNLEYLLENRLNEIPVMSELISNHYNIKWVSVYNSKQIKKEILRIPIEERMREEENIKTKYPLRKAYENILPEECIYRPQTMAFSGSGIFDTIKSIGSEISDLEYEYACNKYFQFRNKFEYALFKMYVKHYEFKQVNDNACIHCQSDLGNNKVNCRVCATLQLNGKEISFDGDGIKKIRSRGY